MRECLLIAIAFFENTIRCLFLLLIEFVGMGKNWLSYWLFGSLLFTYSGRCWINLFPILHMPFISTLLASLTLLIPVVTFGMAYIKHQVGIQTLEHRNLILLLTIYYAYCAYYIANPKVLEPQKVPESVASLLFSIFPLYLLIFMSGVILQKCNIILFAKISVISIVTFLVVYFSFIDIALYGMFYGMSKEEIDAMSPSGFISGLSMGQYISMAYCSNLYVSDRWTPHKRWNTLITISIAIFLFIIQFMLVERGPILSMLMVAIFFLACRKVVSNKRIVVFVIVSLFLYFFMDFIISILSQLSSSTMDKFMSTADTGGSGRFGSDDAIFPAALKQISEEPLFGTYFRCCYGTFSGTYPHNIILELLMTFGLVFSIPLFVLMCKATMKTYNYVGLPCFLFGLVFVYRLLQHFTSGTIIEDKMFWLSFAIILSANYKIGNKQT